ncbi:MAG: hypothetical protein LUQ50_09140 [Methanospirillum sp.]|uniref:hypothetical protein n=1 Tax=Methanospirillum sp. TaxID=45200 RepID=UPI00236BBB5B|nr:hypothetical protein [Methanospirillum sp.]MDD1729223.1 hypothetical protein [Methanospirillum sp.]
MRHPSLIRAAIKMPFSPVIFTMDQVTVEKSHMTMNGRILVIGEDTIHKLQDASATDHHDRFILVQSVTEALDLLQKGETTGLIIGREHQKLTTTEMKYLAQTESSWFLLLWPPDVILNLFIWPDESSKNSNNREEPGDQEHLRERIATLEARNTTLEASVRTLITALSQCEAKSDVYTGDEHAWDLIMEGIPVADQDSEFQTDEEQESDEDDKTGEEEV